MSKAVLISIRSKWCQLIAIGEKTIEIRKTRPKLETPFKVYIYATKAAKDEPFSYCVQKSYDSACGKAYRYSGGGEVIGEFICDTFVIDRSFGHDATFNAAACMTEVECAAYSCCSPLYGWHISNLKIYYKPKEISQFGLKRPPQSWCYVEEREE